MLLGYMDNLEITSTECHNLGLFGVFFPKIGMCSNFRVQLVFFFQVLSFDFFSVGLMAYASVQKGRQQFGYRFP